MLSVGLPVLRGERIDAGVAGARAEYRALVEMHDDHRYELAAELTRAWSDAQRVDELLRLYDEELLPLVAQSGEAALLALRHDRGGVEDAVAAQQLGLETRLKRARLLADRALAQHDIDYLSGDRP
jgi:outer membrane protein TolC